MLLWGPNLQLTLHDDSKEGATIDLSVYNDQWMGVKSIRLLKEGVQSWLETCLLLEQRFP